MPREGNLSFNSSTTAIVIPRDQLVHQQPEVTTRSVAVRIRIPETLKWMPLVLMKRAIVSQDYPTVRGLGQLPFLNSRCPTDSNLAVCAISPCKMRCSFPRLCATSWTAFYHVAIMQMPFYVAPLQRFTRTRARALSPRCSADSSIMCFPHIDTESKLCCLPQATSTFQQPQAS